MFFRKTKIKTFNYFYVPEPKNASQTDALHIRGQNVSINFSQVYISMYGKIKLEQKFAKSHAQPKGSRSVNCGPR